LVISKVVSKLVAAAGLETDTVNRISAEEFAKDTKRMSLLSLISEEKLSMPLNMWRKPYSKPLAYINEWVKDIKPNEHFFMHCAGGYRSMIASSILQARGYRNFTEVEGGFKAIAETSVPRTNFICQSKVMNS
jgi:hydroxyacylglutathione hydrolase